MEKHKTADILIANYNNAANRTRNVFLTSNFVTVLLIVAYFNLHWSWARHLIPSKDYSRPALYYEGVYPNDNGADDRIDFKDAIAKKYYEDFKFIHINWLGLKIYVYDIPILAGFATGVIMTWFFYTRRRETSIIKELANEIQMNFKESKYFEFVKQVIYSTTFTTIFNNIPNTDKESKFQKRIIKALIFAPPILLLVFLIHDLFNTLFLELSVLEEKNGEYFIESINCSLVEYLWFYGKIGQIIEIILRSVLGGLLIWYSFRQAKKIMELSTDDGNARNQIFSQFQIMKAANQPQSQTGIEQEKTEISEKDYKEKGRRK